MPASTELKCIIKRLQESPEACVGLMAGGRLKGIVTIETLIANLDSHSGRLEGSSALECASTSFVMTSGDVFFTDFLYENSSKSYDNIILTSSHGQISLVAKDTFRQILTFKNRRIREVLPVTSGVPALNEKESCLKALELLSHEEHPHVVSLGNDGPTGVVTRHDISRAIEMRQNLWDIRLVDVAQSNVTVLREDISAEEALFQLEGNPNRLIICEDSDGGVRSVVDIMQLRRALIGLLKPKKYEIAYQGVAQRQLSDILIERVMSDTMGIGVVALTPDLEIQYSNRTAKKLLGLSSVSLSRKSAYSLSHDIPLLENVVHAVGMLDPVSNPVVDLSNRTDFPSNYQTKLTGVWKNNDPSGFIVTIQNSTDVRLAEAKLRKLAYYDALTGLPNRTLLFERLNMEIRKSRRYNEEFAVVFVDLNGFKGINDRYGHRYGDQLLIKVANRFSNVLRETDTVARLGGDEFLFILPGASFMETAWVVSKKILAVLDEPIVLEEVTVSIDASFGTAYFPENGLTPEELIDFADQEMYESKRLGL
ncbi:diguanylate cyclase domain-containing protein [Pseudodesulfovibrio piezophilus]|nr:diguanylate cyclase [Pseudodesulfovibrio piezophilus]